MLILIKTTMYDLSLYPSHPKTPRFWRHLQTKLGLKLGGRQSHKGSCGSFWCYAIHRVQSATEKTCPQTSQLLLGGLLKRQNCCWWISFTGWLKQSILIVVTGVRWSPGVMSKSTENFENNIILVYTIHNKNTSTCTFVLSSGPWCHFENIPTTPLNLVNLQLWKFLQTQTTKPL